jgi:hypothetical protein
MANHNVASTLDGLIRDILNFADEKAAKPCSRNTEEHFRAVASRDYASALRKLFDHHQLFAIYSELQAMLPALNAEVFTEKELRRLSLIAAGLGAGFQASDFNGSSGRGLRGFYVKDGAALKRPLICVNTASHPVAVAAAFWHELGHHLTSRTLDVDHRQPNLSFTSNYHKHLDDPWEAAADIVPVLAAYPKAAARRLFGRFLARGETPDINQLVSKARPHLRFVSGFFFQRRFSAKENLHYLAGMIHYVKLRWVLLAEYGI